MNNQLINALINYLSRQPLTLEVDGLFKALLTLQAPKTTEAKPNVINQDSQKDESK